MTNDLKNTMSCKETQAAMLDLLSDESVPAAFSAHLATCESCRTELAELRATFAMMDEWAAPEPSTYFDSKLHAKLREAQAAEPEGFFERIRSYFLYSSNRHLRPAMAGALGLVLLVGGGTYAGLYEHNQLIASANTSATVTDLTILDKNETALEQMDQLLDDQSQDNGDMPTT
jgi:anti-sigma factor RsiW